MSNNTAFFDAARAENRDKWLCADSWYAAEKDAFWQKHSDSCYIIQVVSSKGGSTTAVEIGDSFTNRVASNFNQDADIAITSTISGVTYQEFLAQSEAQPFIVGRTMIISTSSGQIERSVGIRHRNVNGDLVQRVIAPLVDPYQNQTDRIIDDTEYIFDGMTLFNFRIDALATVTIRLYLLSKFAASQIIAGRPAVQKYKPPHLIKAT